MRLEYNNTAQAESFEIQYQNCMKMIANMNLLNDGLKVAKLQAAEGRKYHVAGQ